MQGLPALDLLLLDMAADGTVGRLRPDSSGPRMPRGSGFFSIFVRKRQRKCWIPPAKTTKNDTDSTRNGILRKKIVDFTTKVTGVHRISS
jgi:hypothetical protein